MPRKTRILHGEDEYLFVEAPGDPAGPALQIFARPENARAVAPGRAATHQSEHGLWIQIARFDGTELALAPDPPSGLGDRLKKLLPKYTEIRRDRKASAKSSCFSVIVTGRPLHALHVAQPAGLVLRLWRSEAAARSALAVHGADGSVETTGDLREHLELRAEEGFAGALLDDEEIVFFCLDEDSHVQFLKVSAPRGENEVASHLLDETSRWQPYEGSEKLDPFIDPESWDRLMVRTFGRVPFVGHRDDWSCFALSRDGVRVTAIDPEGDGKQRMVALFHDAAAAETFRAKHRLGRASIERVDDLRALLADVATHGAVARLHPGDHRARAGTFWLDDGAILFDSFSGIWRSRDGRDFDLTD